MSTLRERIAGALFGDVIEAAVKESLAAVTVRVDDSPGWDSHQAGPADRPWAERYSDLEDGLNAWRRNFMVRRIVTLVRSYVIGNGIAVSSTVPEVDEFVKAFWNDPRNRIDRRLGPWCDEVTRAGEIFPVLFTNRLDGMSYVRAVPASMVREIETAKNDYETERRYGILQRTSTELTWRIGVWHWQAYLPSPKRRALRPLMLHFCVNRPVGATRGEGDLGPILSWAKRYSEWLKDRVRLNRQRTRQQMLDVEVADDSLVEEKREQLRTNNPTVHGIYVHGPGEKIEAPDLKIESGEAKEDGRVLRLAMATGANVGLHYLGEGESVNYATAKEMGEPAARFYTGRQMAVCWMVTDLVETAFRRAVCLGKAAMPKGGDLGLVTSVAEVARADNQGLAEAAKNIVDALAVASNFGWVDDETAVKTAFKFAGEPLGAEKVAEILSRARRRVSPENSEE